MNLSGFQEQGDEEEGVPTVDSTLEKAGRLINQIELIHYTTKPKHIAQTSTEDKDS